MYDIIKQPAYKLLSLIQSKEVSSEEVTRAFLDRIKIINPKINAIIQMDEEKTLQQARYADQQFSKGNLLGPLHGLPITIKDTIDMPDYPISYGSHLYDDYKPVQEGTCVKRLKNAGAVILGLTNSPELLTAYESDNLIYGATNNPYDETRSSGGSSGGEAAIIAVNGSPLGLGSDGGGSIRLPAHFCGIAGFKPTQGLVPKTGISLPCGGAGCLQPFGTCGPMANWVEDLELGLTILSGPDQFDPDTFPVNIKPVHDLELKKLKIAYFTDNGIATPSQNIKDATLKAVSILEDLGAIVHEARPKHIEKTLELHWQPFFQLCDGGETVNQICDTLDSGQISSLRQQFNRDAKSCCLTVAELNHRFAEIAQFKTSMYQFLNQYDVLICPPCATTAKLHGECLNEIKDFTYTMSFNNTGSPAVVIPFGISQAGLPIGIQIVSNLWKDYSALFVAKILEYHQKIN